MRKRKSIANAGIPAFNSLTPPADLDDTDRDLWVDVFSGVPAGQLGMRDFPLMRHHLVVVREERDAFTAMIESGRRKDLASHWRSCVHLLHASARQLRLNPQQRLEPRRIGILDRGQTRDDGTVFQIRGKSKDHWRSLFPAAPAPVKKAGRNNK